MGMHILHDSTIKNTSNPCGFCLAPGPLCCVRLKKGKGRKATIQIDEKNSRCQGKNLVKLSISSFEKSSSKSPCTNVPVTCPLCPSNSDAIWKYNLHDHISSVHPTANLTEYESLYQISQTEITALKAEYIKERRWTAKRIRDLGDIVISEAHSMRFALRYVAIYSLLQLLITTRRAPEITGQENGPESLQPTNEHLSDIDSNSPTKSDLSDGLGSDSDSGDVDTHPSPISIQPSRQPSHALDHHVGSGLLRRSKRSRPQKTFILGEIHCEDTDCEDELNPDDMVQCAGPACGAFVRVH